MTEQRMLDELDREDRHRNERWADLDLRVGQEMADFERACDAEARRVHAYFFYASEKALIQARHEGDPAYETHESPRRLRMREEWERDAERYDQ